MKHAFQPNATREPLRSRQRPNPRRPISELLEPLESLAANSVNLVSNRGARFQVNGESYDLPRYLFLGPKGGDDPIRIGLFATIHGDEPAGAHALAEFVRGLEQTPEMARGYCLFIYPLCNPTGYEDNTRCSRRGRDLNREFWNDSAEPEVQLLQSEICTHAFHGIIALHSDDTSDGIYGFVRGATLSQHLLRPALAAAHGILPINDKPLIDGFDASGGIISRGYTGILGAHPELRPGPFEIVFETPQTAPLDLQVQSLVIVLQSILAEYRELIAYAANL